MRAAVYHGPHDVRIETMPDPGAPGPGEVLLKSLACALCGTDKSEYLHGPLMIPLNTRHESSGHCGPTILGHEFVGQVVAVGDGVTHLTEGMRVAAGAGMWCNHCRWCREGRPNLCQHYYVFGLHAHGALADLVKVPAKMCSVVPSSCRDAWAALAQPYAIALHAVRRSRIRPGESVVLIGAGGIGSFILAALADADVTNTIVLDIDPPRLERATLLGAAATVPISPHADPEEVTALLQQFSDEQADVVIEASGAPGATLLATRLVRRGGRVLQVGLPSKPVLLPLRELTISEIELITTNGHVCEQDLPQALTLLSTTDVASRIGYRLISLDALISEGLVPLARGVQEKIIVALS